jgi:hypothetical protein
MKIQMCSFGVAELNTPFRIVHPGVHRGSMMMLSCKRTMTHEFSKRSVALFLKLRGAHTLGARAAPPLRSVPPVSRCPGQGPQEMHRARRLRALAAAHNIGAVRHTQTPPFRSTHGSSAAANHGGNTQPPFAVRAGLDPKPKTKNPKH